VDLYKAVNKKLFEELKHIASIDKSHAAKLLGVKEDCIGELASITPLALERIGMIKAPMFSLDIKGLQVGLDAFLDALLEGGKATQNIINTAKTVNAPEMDDHLAEINLAIIMAANIHAKENHDTAAMVLNIKPSQAKKLGSLPPTAIASLAGLSIPLFRLNEKKSIILKRLFEELDHEHSLTTSHYLIA